MKSTKLAALFLAFISIAKADVSQDDYLRQRGLISDAAKDAINLLVPSFLGFTANVVNTVGSTLECGACKTALVLAAGALDIVGQDIFLDLVQDACKLIEQEDVCNGVVPTFGPSIATMLKQSDNLFGYSGELICNSFLTTCNTFSPSTKSFDYDSPSTSAVDNFNVSQASFNSSDYLTIMHLSDIHYDPDYLEGSEADCKYPMCCEARTNPSSGTISQPASSWGEYLCDMPYKFIDDWGSQFEATLGNQPDFTLFTGDVPPHNIWYDNTSTVTTAFEIYDVLSKYLTNPLYATFGNHDISPVNMLYPVDLPGFDSSVDGKWAFEALGGYFSQWLPSETIDHFENSYGTYAIRPRKGLKIINLNTVECYIDNFYVFYNSGDDLDPNGQLQWLVNELQDSQTNNEKVWLMGHVAPSDSDCVVPWSNLFDGIVNRYASTIVGQFYGHSHNDKFAVHYDSDGNPSNVQYLAPSLTTFTDLNAGYRTYKIHPETFEVMDSVTYIADMSKASTWDRPEWVKEYSAREYIPNWPSNAPLNATFWAQVAELMKSDDSVFTKYATYISKSSSASTPCSPSASCRYELVTDVKAGNSKNKYYPSLIPTYESTENTLKVAVKQMQGNLTSSSYTHRKRACIH